MSWNYYSDVLKFYSMNGEVASQAAYKHEDRSAFPATRRSRILSQDSRRSSVGSEKPLSSASSMRTPSVDVHSDITAQIIDHGISHSQTTGSKSNRAHGAQDLDTHIHRKQRIDHNIGGHLQTQELVRSKQVLNHGLGPTPNPKGLDNSPARLTESLKQAVPSLGLRTSRFRLSDQNLDMCSMASSSSSTASGSIDDPNPSRKLRPSASTRMLKHQQLLVDLTDTVPHSNTAYTKRWPSSAGRPISTASENGGPRPSSLFRRVFAPPSYQIVDNQQLLPGLSSKRHSSEQDREEFTRRGIPDSLVATLERLSDVGVELPKNKGKGRVDQKEADVASRTRTMRTLGQRMRITLGQAPNQDLLATSSTKGSAAPTSWRKSKPAKDTSSEKAAKMQRPQSLTVSHPRTYEDAPVIDVSESQSLRSISSSSTASFASASTSISPFPPRTSAKTKQVTEAAITSPTIFPSRTSAQPQHLAQPFITRSVQTPPAIGSSSLQISLKVRRDSHQDEEMYHARNASTSHPARKRHSMPISERTSSESGQSQRRQPPPKPLYRIIPDPFPELVAKPGASPPAVVNGTTRNGEVTLKLVDGAWKPRLGGATPSIMTVDSEYDNDGQSFVSESDGNASDASTATHTSLRR